MAESVKGGEALANLIVDSLGMYGVQLEHMVGQGYDGAANMSAQYKGVQARIQRLQPQATYVLCKTQCLNLAIVLACKDAAITNVMDKIQDIAFVLTLNAKKSSWHSRRTSKKLRLQRRWVEKQSYNNCVIPDRLREQTV